MKYIVLSVILASCSAKPYYEMESMGNDVLKAKQGVEIQVFPMPKDNSKTKPN